MTGYVESTGHGSFTFFLNILFSQELCLDANKDGMHDVNPQDDIRVESRLSTPTVKEVSFKMSKRWML